MYPWVGSLMLMACSGLVMAAPQTLAQLPQPRAAPDFALSDLDGQLHRLSDYRGQVLIVNFWATWCPPCRREMPSMERAWQQVKDEGIKMVAINVGQDEEALWSFTAEVPVSFPLLLDESGSVSHQWPMRGLPTTFVVDTQGNIAYQAVGDREWDDPQLLGPIRALATPAKHEAAGSTGGQAGERK